MQNYDQAMQKAIAFAQTPEGQKLIEALRQMNGSELEAAAAKAAVGDFTQARKVLSRLLENPEARKFLENMGG